MRVSVRRVRFVLALMIALILVSSLSIVLSGAAAATTGQQTTSDHQYEDCTNFDVHSGGGDHQNDEDCELGECPELAALNGGGDHQNDEDCEAEECPDVAAQNGGRDEDDDEDCTPTTSTTTTTTTLPAFAPRPLELTAIGAECISDIPYLSYEIDYPPGQSATITFFNPAGPDVVYEDVPLSGAVLWPGASEDPPDWPGWIREDGVWVEADDGFLWARGTVSVLFEVNPSTVVTVSYEHETGTCADPNPDEVGGVVIAPPTTPAEIGGVEVLPFTGFPGGVLAAVAFSVLALGGLMVLSARRDEAEDS
jgi:hypothetical protein